MPLSGSEEVQITFHDAPAYFSDEEWKLLHDWQKELYRNVMKEIHQALISLGPLITTTISSLRAKEKQEQCSSSPKDMHARYIIPDSLSPLITTTISSLRAKEKQEQCSSSTKDMHARYIIPDSLTGVEITNPDEDRFKGKEALDLNCSHDTEGRLRNVCQSKGMAIFKKVKRRKERVILIDDLEQEVEERETNPTLDDSAVNSMFLPRLGGDEEAHIKQEDIDRSITCPDVDLNFSPRLNNSDEVCLTDSPLQRSEEIVSVLIKKEDESSSIDLLGSERMEDIGSETGDESIDRAKEDGDSLFCSEANICSNLFKKRSSIKAHGSHEASDRDEAWAQRGENTTQYDSGFIGPGLLSAFHFSAYQGRPNSGGLSSYRECESNPRNSQFSSCLPNTDSHLAMYKFTECDEVGGTIAQLGIMRTHLRGRPYACTECEKSFFEKSHLIAHQTTHLGERMYTCSFCTKSFNRKYSLLGHMRTHTGEKPYKCTECDKEFIWKSGFNRHQKTHTSNYNVQ
ncbi:uncharacterized protein LOC144768754 [Lissotriton helveticus]